MDIPKVMWVIKENGKGSNKFDINVIGREIEKK